MGEVSREERRGRKMGNDMGDMMKVGESYTCTYM